MKSKEVLALLNISRATLTNYVERGLIRIKERPFGRYDYDEESVRRLIDPEYRTKQDYNEDDNF